MTQFATADDVASRLGRALSDNEVTQVGYLLEAATDIITDEVGKTDTWAAALSPVPKVLRSIAIEATVRVLHNPAGVDSQTETLGAYSHTERFAAQTTATGGLALTDTEGRRARRAVYGKNVAGVRNLTLADHLARSIYDGQTVVLTDPDPDVDTI